MTKVPLRPPRPRRALFNLPPVPVVGPVYLNQVATGVCAQRMHDEDNKFGLWVDNAVGDSWVAYGDARYRDQPNAAGRVVMRKALQQSMDDIWAAYESGSPSVDASLVLQYVPKVVTEITQPATAAQHRDDPRNWAPLFWQDPSDGTVWRRANLESPARSLPPDKMYVPFSAIPIPNQLFPSWTPLPTVVALKVWGHPPYMDPSQYTQFPPVETGRTGQYGWPAGPTPIAGPSRPYSATGPSLYGPGHTSWGWVVDGSPGPTNMAPAPSAGRPT